MGKEHEYPLHIHQRRSIYLHHVADWLQAVSRFLLADGSEARISKSKLGQAVFLASRAGNECLQVNYRWIL